MPCCQCCCGGVTCTEGQQGKCCCGGPSGNCCSESQYCCDGACQSEPCEVCEDYSFFVNWGQFGGFRPLAACYNDNAQFGQETVSVPEGMSTPVRVTITGYADDDLAVNGVSISQSNCRRDGAVSGNFCLNDDSFEIAALDNFGWIASYSVTVCFEPDQSCNPLP